MAWIAPRTFVAGAVLTAGHLNEGRDNFLALSQHQHTGAAGDGDDILDGIDYIDYGDATAPAAPGAAETRVYSTSGLLRYRSGAAGADTNLDTPIGHDTEANKPAAARQGAGYKASDTGIFQRDTGSAWENLGALYLAVRKAADETVNNSTTLQNDDDLLFAVAANANYHARLIIRQNSSTVADFKFQFTVPAGASIDGVSFNAGVPTSSPEGEYQRFDESQVVTVPCNGTNDLMVIDLIIVVAGTAGNVQFQWAQNTAEVSDTKVLEHSLILYRRIE